MSSYQLARYEHVQYTANGGNATWSDGFGYGGYKAGGSAYGNDSGHSFGGGGYDYNGFSGGKMATAGQSWSAGGYGNDSAYYGGVGYGGGYGSNGSSHMVASGGGGGSGRFQIHENKMQNMAANTFVAGQEMHGGGGGCDLLSALVPTSFPPGTDPKIIDCFNRIDKDGSGSISDQELQVALTSFNQRFSLRTVRLLMLSFTGSNIKDVTPKEFVPLMRSLQTWKGIFERYDRNKNGSMDEMELSEAMRSMGYNVSPFVLRLLVSKFDKSVGKSAIEYDYFIECCLIIRGLHEKFKTKEDPYTGTASFTYDELLLTILPFVIMN